MQREGGELEWQGWGGVLEGGLEQSGVEVDWGCKSGVGAGRGEFEQCRG